MREHSHTTRHFAPRHGDLDRAELLRRGIVAAALGWTVHFKVTCEACGARLLFARPNALFTDADCCLCNHSTPVRRGGFLLMRLGLGPEDTEWLAKPDEVRFRPTTNVLRNAWERKQREIIAACEALDAARADLPEPARAALTLRESEHGRLDADDATSQWWRTLPYFRTDEGRRFDRNLTLVVEIMHGAKAQVDALRHLGLDVEAEAA